MAFEISHTQDPAAVLVGASAFLESRPIEHNLILTLLTQRIEVPEPGNYWTVFDENNAVGVVLSSPIEYPATTTSIPPSAIPRLVSLMAKTIPTLPGISGEPGTAARIAGNWTEVVKGAYAKPVIGLRIYGLDRVTPLGAPGSARWADENDRKLVRAWTQMFLNELNSPEPDLDGLVDRNLEHTMLWCDGLPVSMAVATPAVANTARVQGVFTPPEHRSKGYAGACVSALSEHVIGRGSKCVLYTELGNPTSNSIYRRIGYECTNEALHYEFAHR